jgi:hypothetical protein
MVGAVIRLADAPHLNFGWRPARDTRTRDGWIAPIHAVQPRVAASDEQTFVQVLSAPHHQVHPGPSIFIHGLLTLS